MKGVGPEAMISPKLLEKWKKDILKDNLLVSYAIFYVHVLRNVDLLEAMKSSPYYRPWVNVTSPESEIWFPSNRCQNFQENELFEVLLEYWHQTLIIDGHLEVKYDKIDGLGLYSKVEGIEIKYLKDKKATFLFDIESKREMDDLMNEGFNSLFEYDNKVYGLYGLWSLANRSEAVEVGFINLKPNGQTLQALLNITTVKYVAEENNKRMKKSSSLIEFKNIPALHKYTIKNTQDINEETIDSTPNGTTFTLLSKSYKIVDIDPYFDAKHKIGHKLPKKGQQLYICYEDIEVEYQPEESQTLSSPASPPSKVSRVG